MHASLPNFLKEESIVYAVEKDLDVFVDKPLARNSAEGTRIIKKVNAQGARLMTGVNYRYFDSVQKLKTMHAACRIRITDKQVSLKSRSNSQHA